MYNNYAAVGAGHDSVEQQALCPQAAPGTGGRAHCQTQEVVLSVLLREQPSLLLQEGRSLVLRDTLILTGVSASQFKVLSYNITFTVYAWRLSLEE